MRIVYVGAGVQVELSRMYTSQPWVPSYWVAVKELELSFRTRIL